MTSITVKEAQAQLSRLLRRVQDGESFLVTNHGEPVAQIVGVKGKRPKSEMKSMYGCLSGPKELLDKWEDPEYEENKELVRLMTGEDE